MSSNTNTDSGSKVTLEWDFQPINNLIIEQTEKSTINNQYEVLTSSREGIFLQKEYFKRVVASKDNRGYKVMRKGDFTYRSMSDDGIFVFNRLENVDVGLVSPAYSVFKFKKDVVSDFYKYYLNSYIFSQEVLDNIQGGTRLALRFSLFKKITIPVPTKIEQQKIAEILSNVDEQIQKTDQLIKKTKELKKGLMQQLLTKGIGHTELKKTEFGKIPDEWKLALLKDVCEKITDGTHHSPVSYPTGDYMYITAKNIKEKGIVLDNISFVPKETHEVIYKRCDVKKNDVLYIKDGATTGVATINDLSEEFSLLSSVALLRVNKDILSPKFLMYCLNSPTIKQEMLGMMSGNAIKRLTLKKIQTGLVPLPSLEEQQKIVEILSSVDEQIESYEQEKEKYTELKKGLMQHLLTGKIRVTV